MEDRQQIKVKYGVKQNKIQPHCFAINHFAHQAPIEENPSFETIYENMKWMASKK